MIKYCERLLGNLPYINRQVAREKAHVGWGKDWFTLTDIIKMRGWIVQLLLSTLPSSGGGTGGI